MSLNTSPISGLATSTYCSEIGIRILVRIMRLRSMMRRHKCYECFRLMGQHWLRTVWFHQSVHLRITPFAFLGTPLFAVRFLGWRRTRTICNPPCIVLRKPNKDVCIDILASRMARARDKTALTTKIKEIRYSRPLGMTLSPL